MQYEKELKDYFLRNKRQMISDVEALVNINSERTAPEAGKPYGAGAAACLDKAGEIMAGHGFQVQGYDYHVIAADLGPAPRKLDILAHLDVVPAGGGWTVTKPFEMEVLDGRIYGRGTADDKGPAMCAFYAMRAIRDLGIPLKAGVRLILGSDEECGGSDLAYYYTKEKPAEMSFSPDSKFPLIHIEKGRLHLGFTAEAELSAALPRVLQIHGGEKSNVIPDLAECRVKGISEEDVRCAERKLPAWGQVSFSCKAENGSLFITARGLTAHGSAPEKGHNALTALLGLLAEHPQAA